MNESCCYLCTDKLKNLFQSISMKNFLLCACCFSQDGNEWIGRILYW